MIRFRNVPLWLLILGVQATSVFFSLYLWDSCVLIANAEPPESVTEVNLFLDLDKDGAMSFEEFVQSLDATSIQQLDSDHDGALSEEEVRAQKPSVNSPSSVVLRFAEIDTDGDKRLSAKELEAAMRKSPRVRILYDALDIDHNHQLSPAEARKPPLGVGLLRIEF